MIAILGLLFSILSLNADNNLQLFRRVTSDPQQSIASFHYMSGISKTDFRSGGQSSLLTTYTITTPGTYVFVQDIGFEGRSNATAHGARTAIFINSSDVVIDLGGKTLYGSTAATLNGIEIARNLHNICIKNGNIAAFLGAGIFVHKGCDNIRLQNLTISNCAKRGIHFKGLINSSLTDSNHISNCIIDNTIVSKTTGTNLVTEAAGLELDFCYNILVNNSFFGGSTAGQITENAYGVLVESGTHIIFNNCDASGNTGESAAYGFRLSGTTSGTAVVGCALINCSANGNFANMSSGGSAYGFSGENCKGCSFEKCIANGNQGTLSGYGFYGSSLSYCKMEQCEAHNNQAGNKGTTSSHGAFGFYSNSGIGNMWQKCIAVGQRSTGYNTNIMCSGFDLRSETNSTIYCSESISNGDNSDNSWGVGVNLVNALNTRIDSCKIMNNKSAQSNHGLGLRDNDSTSSTLVTNCTFFNNGTSGTMQHYHLSYTSPGELNVTSTVDQGGVGSLLAIAPYQNIIINGSAS